MIWTSGEFNALVVGDKIRRFYNDDNPNNKLIHVRGIVDDYAVIRWWSKSKQRWIYEVFDRYGFSEYDIREIL